MTNQRASGQGVPITRERAGVKSGREIVAGRIKPQYKAFAMAAAAPQDLPERDAHAGSTIDELVLRCWAVGTPVWGADVDYEGRIGPAEYVYMRGKQGTHQFEHTGRSGAPVRCAGHGSESCPVAAISVGDGARRWRYDGADGPSDADAPGLAKQRLDEVRAELRARGFSDADIDATPSIAQIIKALGEAGATSAGTMGATSRAQRYWALLANPDYYRVEDAVRELDEDWWTTGGSDLSVGDRVVVWKARGSERRRGIVALGTVLTEPQPRADADNQYWLQPERGREIKQRVLVRYELADRLPLWADEPGNEDLRALSVARSRGRSVFRVTAAQWARIAELAAIDTGQDSDRTTQAKRALRRTTDSARNKAVELRAMEVAARCYREKGWKVEDVSATESYDLRCTRDGDELHVEVKGVTSDGSDVNLTRNEVEHARERRTALFVLSHVEVSYTGDGPEASGGDARILCPWRVDDGDLTALAYSYRLPGDA